MDTKDTYRGRGLKKEPVKGMTIVTDLGRDLEEVIEEKTITDQDKDTRRSMIAKKGERIVIVEVTIIREMTIQEREGV